MGRQFLDLSIPIENDVASDPPGLEPKVRYFRHQETHGQLLPFFPGLTASDLPDGESWAVETLSLSTHNGTHMDAPWHFHSTQDAQLPGGKRPAMTIDELPLEWCFQRGVKLDFTDRADGYVVTAEDVAQELERIGHALQPLDIVVVNTAAGKRYGEPDYVSRGCGMGRAATLYLAEAGVKIVGTDAWSWDAPFMHTAKKWAEQRDPSIIWEGHKAGKDIGYFQMEKLHNLEVLPPTGFTMICFPVKIRGASAGWIRAVALLDENPS
ncbi:MAG: cyclase family protein [Pseudomonadota bacterium]